MVQRKHDIIARANKLGMGDVTKDGVDIVPEPAKVSAPVPPTVAKPAAVDLTPKPPAAPGKGLSDAEVSAVIQANMGKGFASATPQEVMDSFPGTPAAKVIDAALKGDAKAVARAYKAPPGGSALGKLQAGLLAKLRPAKAAAAAPAAALTALPKPVAVVTKPPTMAGSAGQAQVDNVAFKAAQGSIQGVAAAKVPGAAKKWQVQTLEQMGGLPPGAKKLTPKQMGAAISDPEVKALLDNEPPGTTFYAQLGGLNNAMGKGDLALVAYHLQNQATPTGKLLAAKVYTAMGGGKVAAPAIAAAATKIPDAEIDSIVSGHLGMQTGAVLAMKTNPKSKQLVEAATAGDKAAFDAIDTGGLAGATELKAKLEAAWKKAPAATPAAAPAAAVTAAPKSLNSQELMAAYSGPKKAHGLNSYGADVTVGDEMYFAAQKGQADIVAAAKPTTPAGKELQANLLAAMGAPPVAAAVAGKGAASAMAMQEYPAKGPVGTGTWLKAQQADIKAMDDIVANGGDLAAFNPDSAAGANIHMKLLEAQAARAALVAPQPQASLAVKTPPALPAKLPDSALSTPSNPVGKKMASVNDGMHKIADSYAAGQLSSDAALNALTALESQLPAVPNTYWKKVAKNHAAIKSSIASHAGTAQAAAAVPAGMPKVVQAPAPLAQAAAPPPAPKPTSAPPPKPVFKASNLNEPPDFNKWKEKGGQPLSSKPLQNAANNSAVQEIYTLARKGDLNALKNGTYTELSLTDGTPTGKQIPFDQHPSQHVKSYHADLVGEIDLQLNPPRPVKLGKVVQSSSWTEIDAQLPSVTPGKAVAAVAKSQKIGNYIVLGKAEFGAPLPKVDDTVIGGTSWKTAALDAYSKASSKAKATFGHYLGTSGASALNTNLRNGNIGATTAGKTVEQHMKDFNELLVDVPEGSTFVRRMGNKGYGQQPKPADIAAMQQFLLTAEKGTTIQEPGFTSSSWTGGNSILGNNDIEWKFTAAKGVKVFPAWLGANTGEGEGLFPPNQRYLILGAKKVGKTVVVEAILLPTKPN
jgi:hypothetical protein